MSSEEQTNSDQSVAAVEENASAPTTGLDVALVDGSYVRLLEGVEPPEGSEVYKFDDLDSLELTKLGEIYGALAGVSPKKFKSPKIAVESIAFQLKKRTPTNPWAPRPQTPASADGGTVKTKVKVEKKDKEPTKSVITLLAPDDLAEQLKKLAPQAREVVGILSELAASSGTPTFNSEMVSKALNLPESVARLRTRQSPDRIFAYYRSALIASGIITVA